MKFEDYYSEFTVNIRVSSGGESKLLWILGTFSKIFDGIPKKYMVIYGFGSGARSPRKVFQIWPLDPPPQEFLKMIEEGGGIQREIE